MSFPDLLTISQGARCLLDGGVIAYPTEAVYGLGCDPGNETAVRHILELKSRPESAGMILIGLLGLLALAAPLLAIAYAGLDHDATRVALGVLGFGSGVATLGMFVPVLIATASASASAGGTSIPARPRSSTSGSPPTSEAITGKPAAIASNSRAGELGSSPETIATSAAASNSTTCFRDVGFSRGEDGIDQDRPGSQRRSQSWPEEHRQLRQPGDLRPHLGRLGLIERAGVGMLGVVPWYIIVGETLIGAMMTPLVASSEALICAVTDHDLFLMLRNTFSDMPVMPCASVSDVRPPIRSGRPASCGLTVSVSAMFVFAIATNGNILQSRNARIRKPMIPPVRDRMLMIYNQSF